MKNKKKYYFVFLFKKKFKKNDGFSKNRNFQSLAT